MLSPEIVERNGVRDFLFLFSSSTERVPATGASLPFLFTDFAPKIIDRMGQTTPGFSARLTLSQILINCLQYRGNRRHLIVESWCERDLIGETIESPPNSLFRRDLAQLQNNQFRLITTGEQPPTGTMAEVFWEAHVTTPRLPDRFEDEQMDEMMFALLNCFELDGQTQTELKVSGIQSMVNRLWADNFRGLELAIPTRETRGVFKRLMSATIRFASQLNGVIARAYVLEKIRRGDSGAVEISQREHKLLELRYGAISAFGDINLGLLFHSDGRYCDLINQYAQTLVSGDASDVTNCEEALHRQWSLLRSFRSMRREARNSERRERRQRHRDYLLAPRIKDDELADESTGSRSSESALSIELVQQVLPLLKERDCRRLEAILDANWDRELAAKTLGISRTELGRQWRQTLKPNILRAFKELGVSTELQS